MVGCPTCGAGLRFDIAEQRMVCDHCNSRFLAQELPDDSNADDAQASSFNCFVYICPSCGAELVTTDRNDAVGFCQYCGGASMIYDKMRREWKPDHIIPFQITKEQCKEAYRKEAKRFFVSGKYSKPDVVEGFRGVYMPYWSYRASMRGQFSVGAKGPRERVSSDTYVIPHYAVKGTTDCMMDGYSHDASLSFDDELSRSIAPYEYKNQTEFAPGYLSGFYAESGNVNPHEYDSVIEAEMKEDAVDTVMKTPIVLNYMQRNNLTPEPAESKAPVQIHSVSRSLNPVWFMSCRSGKEITYAAVNGQTGKVAADLPLSPLRILLTALGIGAAVFAVLLLLMNVIPSIKANATLGVCLLLMGAGMYFMQNSFNRTVDKPQPGGGKKGRFPGPGGYMLFLIVGVISLIAMATDGSYEQDVASIARVALMICSAFMVIGHITQSLDSREVKKLQINQESQLRVRIVQEAKGFLSGVLWLKIPMYLTLAAGALVVYLDLANSMITYGMCILCAAELFGLALLHIRFQTQVAKRPLPQFNKKGAQYDEN